tara:strand:- start:2502 stop:3059 length:558 start_codon:yes stop_codon:yes gene_type:complete
MSDEASGAPKTRPILKIILLVILALVVQAAVVFGTLFAAGFFDSPADAESAITAMEESENSDKLDDIVDSDEPQGSAEGGPVYFEIKPELLTNLYNSPRLLQVKVAVMVKENKDTTVVKDIKGHMFAVRSRLLEILAQKREDEVSALGFRDSLAAEFKVAMNDVLEEHLGGRHVEEIYFTEFIVQ